LRLRLDEVVALRESIRNGQAQNGAFGRLEFATTLRFLLAEKIQSTTDAGSLNTFGRNEIEVAPISSALLRIACLVILYKTEVSVIQ